MRFKFTTKKQLKTEIQEMKNDIGKLEREVFRNNGGWITIGLGSNDDQSRIDDIEEKVNKLADNAGLVFKRVDDNFALTKKEDKK